MNRTRVIPFGYKMEMSRMVLDEVEANIVRQIFSMYLSGNSLKSISERMAMSGIHYHVENSEWNKNMVKRILENSKYSGTDSCPRIIEPDDFDKVRMLFAERRQNVRPCPESIQSSSKKTMCVVCGGRMYRLPKKNRSTRWVCQGKECGKTVTFADDQFRTEVDHCLALLAQSPALLDPCADKQQVTPDVLRLQNELTAAFNRGTESPEYMRSLIFSLAAEQYKALPDMSLIHTLKELQDKIAAEGLTEDNRREIEQKAVRRILLSRESGVSIELINGKIISSKEEAAQ